MRVRDLLNAAGRKDPASVRMLASAHASHEELYLLKRLAEDLKGEGGGSTCTSRGAVREARSRPTPSSASRRSMRRTSTARRISARRRRRRRRRRSVGAARRAVDQGRVSRALCRRSRARTARSATCRGSSTRARAAACRSLIYQGVLQTALAKIADVVLPGSAWVEKDATYTNDQGMVQAASKVDQPAGRSRRGLADPHQRRRGARPAVHLHDVAARARRPSPAHRGRPDTPGSARPTFNRPVSAEHWLQASNPMERWKWNTMFQDLPPVKGHNVQMESAPQPSVIPLTLVNGESARD